MNTKRTAVYDIRNPGLGQVQQCSGVKPVNVITILPLLITDIF